jgi:hypothetical protein
MDDEDPSSGLDRWQSGVLPLDMVRCGGLSALLGAAVVSLVEVVAFGGDFTSAGYQSASWFVAVVGFLAGALTASRLTAYRVGTSADGFTLIRATLGGRSSDDAETFAWSELLVPRGSVWTPFLGRKWPVAVDRAGGQGRLRMLLTRPQAELLSRYDGGSALRAHLY